MHAMPVLVVVLCLLAIAYRYYSAFLAARVATLNDLNQTPAHQFRDGHNYDPTNKWVLFGHHFAAISGAGPLIGPVLAAQFGYLPGLLWIVIGVCFGGAVQDFLVLVASMRRGGRSLAEIARQDISRTAGIAATTAILFIIILALAGLGKVVVKALGGEEVKYPDNSILVLPAGQTAKPDAKDPAVLIIPAGATLRWNFDKNTMVFHESFPLKQEPDPLKGVKAVEWKDGQAKIGGAVRLVPGSFWGTFTIACTIPIALFVGFYMYKLRPGKVVEASLIGAALTLTATFIGGMIAPESGLANALNLSARQVTIAMAIYGFIASVLPVWVLLCPRDYLSSFLKIGTIDALVLGAVIANPRLQAPAFNNIFAGGGPTVAGRIFPFLFITIMCGAISGFHSLVSSGTTPKMVKKETDARAIGYGAMLIEGLVGVVAMIAAATLPVSAYYDMNTDLAAKPLWQDKILLVGGAHGVQDLRPDQDPVNEYEHLTQESLRGRSGGAVTLAVGFARIFDEASAALHPARETREKMWKYWYHFAIMFEALFILTTIDAGTRIGRFLFQEVAGKIHPSLGLQGNWIGAALATAIIVSGWGWFMNADSFKVIWGMFGIANQTLAIIALAVITAWLHNEGKGRYLWVTLIPICVVMTTTFTASMQMMFKHYNTLATQFAKPVVDRGVVFNSLVQGGLTLAMFVCTLVVLVSVAMRVTRRTTVG
jgi:carbon starvation protein